MPVVEGGKFNLPLLAFPREKERRENIPGFSKRPYG